jgi:hypothetical protein
LDNATNKAQRFVAMTVATGAIAVSLKSFRPIVDGER